MKRILLLLAAMLVLLASCAPAQGGAAGAPAFPAVAAPPSHTPGQASTRLAQRVQLLYERARAGRLAREKQRQSIKSPPLPLPATTQEPAAAPVPADGYGEGFPLPEKEVQEAPEDVPPSSGFVEEVEAEFIKVLNRQRAQEGLGPLQYQADLAAAARLRSQELMENGYFEHTRPNGSPWHTVLEKEYPVSFRIKGENLAQAFYRGGDTLRQRTAKQWYEQWAASPGHYANMFKEDYAYIGVGIYYRYAAGHYKATATTLFAGD